ncbi:FtsX-like permease family protein [Actinomyces dentalis]|uniref:FtsX-like permease family protein n=1 Tax=Actinomyces dentalis TaxID=272548 RepID=UPI00040B4E17|nr:FtsX-like permease family protein [Actinomyces dentalis]
MPSLLDARRTAAALVAVALSAALIAFAFIVSDSFTTQLTAAARASVGDADVVVLPQRGEDLPESTAQNIAAAPGVKSVRPYIEEHAFLDRNGAGDVHVFVLDAPGASANVTEGRLPASTGEIAISSALAQTEGISVGDSIPLRSLGTDRRSASAVTASVVGVIAPTAAMTRNDPQDSYVFATADERAALGLNSTPAVLYVTGDGTSAAGLLDSVTRAAGGAQVYTADDIVAMRAANGQSGVSATLTLLGILGPVCAVVAAIVIATTFTTLVARQTRTTGLLRCIGASRRQVMGAVLRTAALTGVLGSILGAGLGTGAAALLVRSGVVDGLGSQYLTITPASLALAVGLSALVTLIAVLRPTRRAARVSPLVALTGVVADDRTLGRRRLITAVLGVLLILAGAALTGVAVLIGVPEITAVGAVVLTLGILAALPLLVVGASRLIGRLAGAERHPVLQLAARNLERNPGRASATTAALLVSVGVATTMVVGMATVAASMSGYLASSNPVDITVQSVAPDDDAAALTSRIEQVDGVRTAVLVPELTVRADSSAGSDDLILHAVDEAAVAPIIRSHAGLEGLNDGTLVVGEANELPEGSQVTLTGPAGAVTLSVHVEKSGLGPVITPAVAHRLAGDAPTARALWARTSGDGSDAAPAARVREALRGTGLVVTASVDGRTAFVTLIHRATLITAAVLGLTLLITLSGLANTTDVSVLERTREIGVLRATGTGRAQVRGLFLTEAVLTAVLGGLIGTVLGAVVGIAGVTALMGPAGASSLAPAIPWLEVLGILLASAAVGVLASLRPAGRAAAIAPVAALATD